MRGEGTDQLGCGVFPCLISKVVRAPSSIQATGQMLCFEKRREYFPVGSTPASLPARLSNQTICPSFNPLRV